jgi:hypothetical protein
LEAGAGKEEANEESVRMENLFSAPGVEPAEAAALEIVFYQFARDLHADGWHLEIFPGSTLTAKITAPDGAVSPTHHLVGDPAMRLKFRLESNYMEWTKRPKR